MSAIRIAVLGAVATARARFGPLTAGRSAAAVRRARACFRHAGVARRR